jgi:ribA/ribD-fused uncharacterized protein
MAFFFWKPAQPNGWLSNWSKHPIVDNGVTFPTAEHYLMHHKALLMGDAATAARILKAKSPCAAKMLGRSVDNWDEERWCSKRKDIMRRGLALKVEQHPDLLALLTQTGASVLAEASPDDKIWGIGCSVKDKRAADANLWPGRNLLGECWMEVRAAL